MAPWKLGLFDWNGTLIDDVAATFEGVLAIFRHYGLPPPTLERFRDEIESDFMKFYVAHGIPRTATHEALNRIREAVLHDRWQDVRLHEGVVPLLTACREADIDTALVTAEIPSVVHQRLAQFDLAGRFLFVHSGGRPKEKSLRETLEVLEVNPRDAFFVDDTHEGIMAATRVGIGTTFGFTRGYASPERIALAEPTVTVNSLAEIREVIESAS